MPRIEIGASFHHREHFNVWRMPAKSVAVETGYRQGDQFSIDYDPLLAKIICHGGGRPTAIARARRALATRASRNHDEFALPHPASSIIAPSSKAAFSPASSTPIAAS